MWADAWSGSSPIFPSSLSDFRPAFGWKNTRKARECGRKSSRKTCAAASRAPLARSARRSLSGTYAGKLGAIHSGWEVSSSMATKLVETTCVMDCPDACSLEVRVTDGAIQEIRGRDDHPTSRGFICSKVAGFAKRVYHDSRLLHPMRRAGSKGEGDFVPVSWEAAIGEITERFQRIIREWGGEAILPYHYGGSNGALSDGLADSIYFAGLGSSRLARTICATPTTQVALGMYGRMPGVAFEDYSQAKCVIVWGATPRASNIHLVPFLQEAKRRGALVAVVDPRANLSSRLVDLHLPVYPGSDLPVALAMIRFWQEHGKLGQKRS